MRKTASVLLFSVLVSVLAPHAFASVSVPTTPVSPASVGLSQAQLDNLTSLMNKQVREEKMAGSVALVARHGKIAWLEAVGRQDREAAIPMDSHVIFRIASVSKKDDGFGLGVSVRRAGKGPGPGTFGWGGFWYTTFFVDPEQQRIGIAMGQLRPDGGATLNGRFEGLVRKALVE